MTISGAGADSVALGFVVSGGFVCVTVVGVQLLIMRNPIMKTLKGVEDLEGL